MGALSKIVKAGFSVVIDGNSLNITPASKLTMQQREFLKLHKAEIITELQTRQSDIELQIVKCGDCLNFKCFNLHGNGAGTCLVGGDYGLWSETPHQCGKFDAAVEWVQYEEPQGETVQCFTPNGKPIKVKATSTEQAAWLMKMNPDRVMP